MKECLHLLEPPPRKLLVQDVKTKDPKLLERLAQAEMVTKRANAAKLIYRMVMQWHREKHKSRTLMKAIALAQQREQEKNAHNLDDDLWSYGGSSTGGQSHTSSKK